MHDNSRRWPKRTRSQSLGRKRTIAGIMAVCLGTILICLVIWLWITGPKYSVSSVILAINRYPDLMKPAVLFVDQDVKAITEVLEAAASRNVCEKPISLVGPECKSVESFLMSEDSGQDDIASIDNEILIVYAPLHLVCQFAERKATNHDQRHVELAIACSDYIPGTRNGLLPIEKLITSLQSSKAKTKLLILDSGRAPAGPREGILAGEYFDELYGLLLREAAGQSNGNGAESTDDGKSTKRSEAGENGDVWILTSHGPWERSHLLYEQKRSVFGYYLAMALGGEADDDDHELMLGELYRYLYHHVSGYVWDYSKHQHVQTPMLLHLHGNQVHAIKPEDLIGPQKGKYAKKIDDVLILRTLSEKADGANKERTDEIKDEKSKATDSDTTSESGKLIHNGNQTDSLNDRQPKSEDAALDKKPSPIENALPEQDDGAGQLNITAASIEWSPVDYAPHKWRQQFQKMIAEDSSNMPPASSTSFQKKLQDIQNQKDVKWLEERFLKSGLAENLRQDDVLRAAFQSHNRLLFEIPYYIQLTQNEPTYGTVTSLIDKLREIGSMLSGSLVLQPDPTVDMADKMVLTPAQQDRLRSLCKEIDSLHSQVRKQLALESDTELNTGDPVYLSDLLRTPLPDSHQRATIWRVLLARNKEKSPDGIIPGPPREDERSEIRTLHWKRLRSRIVLYAKLLRQLNLATRGLSDSAPSQGIATWVQNVRPFEAVPADSENEENRLLRHVAEAVRNSYREIPRRIKSEQATPRDRVVGLRLLDPLDTEPFTEEEIADWFENQLLLTKQYFVLTPPSLSMPIVLGSGENFYEWQLNAVGRELPKSLHVALEYQPSLLDVQIEGDSAKNGIIQIDDTHSDQWIIRLNIQPKKYDGSIVDLIVSLEGIEGFTRRQSKIEFSLPQPRFLDVSVDAALDHLYEKQWTAEREDGIVQATAFQLKPYPSGRTKYRLVLRNLSTTRERSYKYTLWAFPDQWRYDFADLETRKESDQQRIERLLDFVNSKKGILVTSQEAFLVPIGEIKPLPLFPVPTKEAGNGTAAGREDAADDSRPAAETGPTALPDVSGGLLVDLVDLEKIDGKPGYRQLIWLDVQVLHPESYVKPKPLYDPKTSELKIGCQFLDSDDPPDHDIIISWEVPEELSEYLDSPSLGMSLSSKPSKMASKQSPLSAVIKDTYKENTFPVILSVDGYARAFEYDRTLLVQEVSPKVIKRKYLRVSILEDEEGHPKLDKEGKYTILPDRAVFQKLPYVHALLEADFPRKPGSKYRAQLVLEKSKGEQIAFHEFRSDRKFSIHLIKSKLDDPKANESSSDGMLDQFELETKAQDLIHTFETESIPEQELTVRAILLVRNRESDKYEEEEEEANHPLGRDRATVIHDSVPPKILDVRAVKSQLYMEQPATIEITVTDDGGSGVDYLLYSWQLTDEKLKDPQRVPAEHSDPSQTKILLVLPKEALKERKLSIYSQAVDQAGNVSGRRDAAFQVNPVPPPPPEVNILEVNVRWFDWPAKNVDVTLVGADVTVTQKTDNQGKCTFAGLKPGKYQVSAQGMVGGGEKKWAQEEITIIAPPAPPSKKDLIAR